MTIPALTETLLRDRATAKVFQRGEQYYHSGAVVNLCLRGNTLQATVEGNEVEPYRVRLEFDRAGIKQVYCTCAYAFEGWCKHIIATALHCLREPETIRERPSLETLLDQLNPIQTQGLIQELVAQQPELMEAIDPIVTQILQPIPPPMQQPKRRTTVDPQPYRHQVKHLLRETVRYWEDGGEDDPIAEELPDIVAQAQAFTAQGDGDNALVILAAITQACVDEWDELEDYGGNCHDLIALLDPVWAEAILSTDLLTGEAVDLQINLEAWQDALGDAFDLGAAALRQGWDDPDLEAVLRGESTDLWGDERPNYADELARIRLSILERQQRLDEYLNLARAEAIIPEYLTLLAALGRIEEVMAQKSHIRSVQPALEVAKALREAGAVWEALDVAQYGLTLPESTSRLSPVGLFNYYEPVGIYRYKLADWTSDLAQGLGEQSAALAARIEAFKAKPSFKDYQNVQHLAGEMWLTVKADLLNSLRQNSSWGLSETQVNIFLHEGLIDDAISTVERHASDALIHTVMKAAIPDRPNWVMETSRRYAEQIMNRGKAEAYDQAIKWLGKTRGAYYQLGQETEWKSYRSQLMSTHARKYKLMGLLKQSDLE